MYIGVYYFVYHIQAMGVKIMLSMSLVVLDSFFSVELGTYIANDKMAPFLGSMVAKYSNVSGSLKEI